MSDNAILPDIIAYGRVRRLEKEIIVKSAASNCGGPEKPRMVPGARPDSRADRAGAVPDVGVNGQSASSCSGFELQLVPSHTKTAASEAAVSSRSDLVRESSGGFLRGVRGFVGFRRHLAGQLFTGLGRKLGRLSAEFLRDTTE